MNGRDGLLNEIAYDERAKREREIERAKREREQREFKVKRSYQDSNLTQNTEKDEDKIDESSPGIP